MRFKRQRAGITGLVVTALLSLTACHGGQQAGSASSTGGESGQNNGLFKVVRHVHLKGSPTFDAMEKRGKVVIGVKEDQPGLGYYNVTTKKRSGFDIDIARWIAASLGFGENRIEFKPVPSVNREQAIINGDIDYFVGTYSITPKREKQVSFAGPYFITGQGLLVSADNRQIKSEKDLNANTIVCSATGSTPIQNMHENFPQVPTREFDLYSACVEALLSGQVQAVTTDRVILLGYAAQNPSKLKVVGKPFTVEKYGIGLARGDTVLKHHINMLLAHGNRIWQAIFNRNLGKSGVKVTQPKVDTSS